MHTRRIVSIIVDSIVDQRYILLWLDLLQFPGQCILQYGPPEAVHLCEAQLLQVGHLGRCNCVLSRTPGETLFRFVDFLF